jgi:hypothetical protein
LPQFLSIVCDPERTNQLNLLPDKDLVDLCPPYRTIPSNEEPKLPATGNYEIIVGGTRGNATYKLNVKIQ